MPHIAPLYWLISSLTFWFLIAMIMTFLWWNQHPNLSISSMSSLSAAPKLWKW